MALTLSNRVERVTTDGRRAVEYTATFDDGSAADITLADAGFTVIDEVWVKAASSGGSGVDITANDSTKITLDPVAATAPTIRIVGH